MERFSILKELVKKHRSQLLITYVLFAFEMLGALLRPFFLGVAINDLLKGSYNGLVILCMVHIGCSVVGTMRHMYDTRTYSAVYVSLVTKLLSRRTTKTEVSKLSAHSTLAREFIDFLEFDLVYVTEAVFNLLGSLVLLFFYNSLIVLLCMSILLPVVGISYVYGKKMKRLNKHKNDELERQVDVIAAGDKIALKKHYNNLRKWQIRISDQEALNFGFMEILVMIVIAISLLVTYKISGTSVLAGNLVGIYTYVLKFVSGLDTIPYTVQRLTALNDITSRIAFHVEDNEESKIKTINHVTDIQEVA